MFGHNEHLNWKNFILFRNIRELCRRKQEANIFNFHQCDGSKIINYGSGFGSFLKQKLVKNNLAIFFILTQIG